LDQLIFSFEAIHRRISDGSSGNTFNRAKKPGFSRVSFGCTVVVDLASSGPAAAAAEAFVRLLAASASLALCAARLALSFPCRA
jgi:hypothetical protein